MHVESVVATYDEIEGVRIEGNEYLWYEVEYLEFSLAGKPSSRVGIVVPHGGRIDEGHALLLSQVGPWRLHCKGYGQVGAYDSTTMEPIKSYFHWRCIDVGSEGPFAESLPFEVHSIGDIITHYDELVALFAEWPTEKSPGRLEDSSGQVLEFYVEPIP